MSQSPITDIELWNLVKQGDRLAFDELYNRYWATLYKICYWHLQDQEATKDIVQELFINLWLKKDKIHIGETVEGYLVISTRNRMLNYIKSTTVRKRRHIDFVKTMQYRSFSEDEISSDAKLKEVFINEIEKLPEKMRQVFLLNKVYGYSTVEIAGKFQLSQQTVKNQLSTASKRVHFNIQKFLSSKNI